MAAPVYRFSGFVLHPQDRLLRSGGRRVPLPPKAFDVLLCLVRRAGGLVSKSELMEKVWPDTYVSETSLTNVVVGLRKVLGREAISTVSKHGYRFELPVEGEPNIHPNAYARFVRAKELTAELGVDSAIRACELYWTCLAEEPGFAPAWAWMGRTAYRLAKFTDRRETNLALAEAAFQRAFAIDPDLAVAHQFYTALETDTGRAMQALARLTERAALHPEEPATFAGLVHVFRYCGLLEESAKAHERAVELDPTMPTSVTHTYFLQGDYAAALDMYAGKRSGAYLDAACWAALGETRRAVTLLRERTSYTGMILPLIRSLLAVLEDRAEEAVAIMDDAWEGQDPEALVYYARHYGRVGAAGRAVAALRAALERGFVCPPTTLDADPWLRSLSKDPEYAELRRALERRVREAKAVAAKTARQPGKSRGGAKPERRTRA
ncbi:MAG: winged helix-turn-helix domain-containing protein [Bryobacteraceae bacterium]